MDRMLSGAAGLFLCMKTSDLVSVRFLATVYSDLLFPSESIYMICAFLGTGQGGFPSIP